MSKALPSTVVSAPHCVLAPVLIAIRQRLLGSTAVTLSLLTLAATSVQANELLINGVNYAHTSPFYIYAAPGNIDTVIRINSANLVVPAYDTVRVVGLAGATSLTVGAVFSVSGGVSGAYLTSTTGNITVTNYGAMTGSIYGVVMDSRFWPDGGNLALSGSGTLGDSNNSGPGAWLLADTGSITLNGHASISGGNYGILVNSNGNWAGTTAGGNVSLGTTTALGAVTARADHGIYVDKQFNSTGDGAIT